MADYSEFPTTPTGWQETAGAEWETVTPLTTEDIAPPRGGSTWSRWSRASSSSSWPSCS